MTIIARQCDECQVEYQAETRYLNRGQGKFCSRSCSSKYLHRPIVHESNTSCSFCSKEFYRRPSLPPSKSGKYFCSDEHRILASGKQFKVGPTPHSKTVCKYLNCNKITSHSSEMCPPCFKSYRIETWLYGDNSIASDKNGEAKPFVKTYLKELRGDKCEECGFDEKTPWGTSIIQMDHIDGNYKNNLIQNLRLLCPNHHAMTETYGARNLGKGRAYRYR